MEKIPGKHKNPRPLSKKTLELHAKNNVSPVSNYKAGRLTNPEKKWIEENADFLNELEIAKHLNRRVETIRTFCKYHLKKVTKKQEAQIEAEFNIKAKKYWKQIKQQFTQAELELFIQHWSEIVEQFHSDIIHTESMQIIDLIKLEILCDRCLSQQKDVIDSINTLQTLSEDEKRLGTDRDKDKIFQYEQQIQLSRGARNSLQGEYMDLLNRKENLRKSLKSTREQRYKSLEQSKSNFKSWMKEIIINDSLRISLGQEFEKHREAFLSEKKRLSKDHQYLDKQWDKPLLNFQTVSEDEDENDTVEEMDVELINTENN